MIEYFIKEVDRLLNFVLVYAFNFDKSELDIYIEHEVYYGYMYRNGILTKFKITEDEYGDGFFRWNKGDFEVDSGDLILNISKNRLIMYSASKVKDRILANRNRVKSNKDKTQFGCNMSVVKDMVSVVKISELEIEEFNKIIEDESSKSK